MVKRRGAVSLTVSLDRDLAKRFRAACRRRDVPLSRVVTRMVKYYLAHRYAFANGLRRPKNGKKILPSA